MMQSPNSKPISALLIGLVSLLGAALVFASALAMGLSAFMPLMEGRRIQATGTILGVSFGFESLLLFAAAFFCLQKYLERPQVDQPVQFQLKIWHISVLLLGTAVSLLIGHFTQQNRIINWLVLPVFTVPAVMLPILLFFALGARQIQLGPRWRLWGILGLGMTIGPLILVVVEIGILVVLIIGAAVLLGSQPGFSSDFARFADQLNSIQNDQQAILNLIIPFLLKPSVILSAILYIGVLVPFTEELVKPIGVWLFANKLESPAQGFALGTLSGAVYAFVETFGSSAQTLTWSSLLSSRIGTGLLHVTTTSLMGWGIAIAWQKHQYLRLLIIYVLSAFLHGAWNTSVLVYTFSTLAAQASAPGLLSKIGPYSLGIAGLIAVLLLAILVLTNTRMTKTVSITESETDGKITS